MKLRALFLMLIMIVMVNAAFASNDNDGKKEEPKIEVKQTAVKLSVLPACGGTGGGGWTDSGSVETHPVTGQTYAVYTRPCVETIVVHFPPAPPYSFVFESTDRKLVPIYN